MDTLTLGAVAGLAVTFLIVGLWQRRLARGSCAAACPEHDVIGLVGGVAPTTAAPRA